MARATSGDIIACGLGHNNEQQQAKRAARLAIAVSLALAMAEGTSLPHCQATSQWRNRWLGKRCDNLGRDLPATLLPVKKILACP